MFLFVSRVMTQMAQQLMRMKLYTNSQIIPELMWLDRWGPYLNRIPENSLSLARPGTVYKISEKTDGLSTCPETLFWLYSECLLLVCGMWLELICIKSILDTGRSCMRRSCVSRSRSYNSSMKSARGSLKSKAKSRTFSGLALTSRYFTSYVFFK